MEMVFSDGILLFCTSNLYVIDGYCKDPKGTDIIEVEEKANNEWVVDGVVAPVSRYFPPRYMYLFLLFYLTTISFSSSLSVTASTNFTQQPQVGI